MYARVMIRGHSVVSYIIIITPCNEANNDVVKSLPHVRSMILKVCKTSPHVRSMIIQVCKNSRPVRSMTIFWPRVPSCFGILAKVCPRSVIPYASLKNVAARLEVLLQVCKTWPHVRGASASLFALIMAV